MKRCNIILIVTVILFNLGLMGCSNQEIKNPVNFYYVRNEYTYGSSDSVIIAEIHEFADPSNLAGLVSHYLKGPQSSEHASLFPIGTKLVSAKHNENSVSIVLTDQIVRLTDASLTLACTCLAKTIMDYTGIETVNVYADGTLISGKTMLTIREDDIILIDSGIADSQN